jgi:hypothetical protein
MHATHNARESNMQEDIEVRVEQLQQSLSQDPEAFAALLQGVAASMSNAVGDYIGQQAEHASKLVGALETVAANIEDVAAFAE